MNKLLLPFAIAAMVGTGSVQAAPSQTLSASIEGTDEISGQSTYLVRPSGRKTTGVFNVEVQVFPGPCPVDDNLIVTAELTSGAMCNLDFRKFDKDNQGVTFANYFLKVTKNDDNIREANGDCGGEFPEVNLGDIITVEVANGGGVCGTASGTYR